LARNTPLAELDGIVSEAGTLRLAEFELRLMVPPPVPLSATLQTLEERGPRVPGVQEIELMTITGEPPPTVTLPPLLVTAIAPVDDAPKLLLMPIDTPLPPERVTETVAITPSEMAAEFNPHATHVRAPVPPPQVMVLPADDSAGPGVTSKVVTLAAG
jgi:hypothetical protein